MKRIGIIVFVAVWVISATGSSAFAEVVVGPFVEDIVDDQTYTGQDYDYESKAARGGYRSSPGTGAGAGAGAGYRTGPRAPSSGAVDRNRPAPGAGTAAPTTGRWGSFFGGMAAGAFLGHMLNPFGGWGAGGFGGGFYPIISLLVWGGLIYLTYRIIKWLFRGKVR